MVNRQDPSQFFSLDPDNRVAMVLGAPKNRDWKERLIGLAMNTIGTNEHSESVMFLASAFESKIDTVISLATGEEDRLELNMMNLLNTGDKLAHAFEHREFRCKAGSGAVAYQFAMRNLLLLVADMLGRVSQFDLSARTRLLYEKAGQLYSQFANV